MKKGEIRREQILDAAEKLFFEKGYDRTSVQDILDALGMSKGGFYHYFDAKDSVLKAVNERRARARFDRLSSDLHTSGRSPVEKLNLLLGMTNLFQMEDTPFAALMLRLCYQEKDASMASHRRRVLMDRLLPLVNEVIAEGLADGSLHTRHPLEIGRLLLLMSLDVDDEACSMLVEDNGSGDVLLKLTEILNTWRESVERLVGAPYGTIVLFELGEMLSTWQTAIRFLEEQEAQKA